MPKLFAITGITGNVGGYAADALLAAGHRVRGIVRDEKSDNSKALKAKGVELAVASFTDTAALTKAFEGVDGVFFMTPPLMNHPDPRKESLEYTNSAKEAVLSAKVPRVVLLSSIGAHIADEKINGPIIKCYDTEQAFFPLSKQLTVISLRPGYFAENTLRAIYPAQTYGTFNSLLKLDTPINVITTIDIGSSVADLLNDTSISGKHIVQLSGPQVINYEIVSNIFFKLSGKTLPVAIVPVEARAGIMKSTGASPAVIELFFSMIDSLENGTLTYEEGIEVVKGPTTYEQFLTQALAAQKKQ